MSPLDIQSGPVRAEAPPRAATAPPPEARPWSAADGGVGMAFGIFGLAALQAIPPAARWLTRPLAFALLVLWLLFMAAYLRAFLAGEAQAYLRPLVGRFAIGTWVADSAVTGEFLLYAAPGWRPVAMALAAIGLLVWVWYAKVALRGFARMLADPDSCRARGLILLTTVSIQALVLVALKLFPRVRLVAELATVPIGVGYVVYGLGAALVFHRFLRIGTWHLEEDWDDTNCILHGAVSISGLAAVSCPFFPDYLCLLSWAFAAAMVVLVEGVELARLAVRVRHLGWERGAFVYNVSQWARVFTFGMFYAFTLAYVQRFGFADDPGWAVALQRAILAYGQYVVALTLLADLAMFLRARLGGAAQR
ncbi:MAG TPA: hypothetical protein VKY65_20175 [Alphaproteobacteria bacterium]|nr:hypothetical protein [Alphaproteobacteria bacterium]